MNREIRSLTGIRGLAACYVIVYHYFTDMASHINIVPIINFIRHGYLSVDLFFCLSGYIMAENYGKDFWFGASWPSYKRFLCRRLARIYPLYMAITLVAAIFITNHDGVQSAYFYCNTLILNLLLVQAWGILGNGVSLNGPAWSISAEAAAYLLFPILAFLTLFKSRLLAVITGLVALATIVGLARLPTHLIIPEDSVPSGTLNIIYGISPAPVVRCLVSFVLGLIAWRVARSPAFQVMAGQRYICGVICAGLLLLLTIKDSDIIVVAVFPVIIALFSREISLTSKVAASTIPYTLGVFSYSIYLVQTQVMRLPLAHWLAKHGMANDDWVVKFLFLPVVGIAAVFCYYTIERPGRHLLRALTEPNSVAISAHVGEDRPRGRWWMGWTASQRRTETSN